MTRNPVETNTPTPAPGMGRKKPRHQQGAAAKPRQIFITEHDMTRLRSLITSGGGEDKFYLERLEAELDKAKLVAPKQVPDDVITMNSMIRVKDLDTNDERTYRLVFPAKAGAVDNAISILAPIGTALLGCREGDTIEWDVGAGKRRLKVVELVYQPERLGNYVL